MAANTLTVVNKATGAVSQIPLDSVIELAEASVLKLPFGPEELASTSRAGNDLVVVLKNGERITIRSFFGNEEVDDRHDLVLEDSAGVLWLGQYGSSGEFAFAEVTEDMAAGGDFPWEILAALLAL